MATRIKLRRDTSANWTSVNPILANGEMGVEADTRRVKIGDGATKWAALDYAIAGDLSVSGKKINTELGVQIASQDPETWVNKIKSKANWAGVTGTAYDSLGNLYVAGWEEQGYDGQYDNAKAKSFLTKFDSQGAVVWSKFLQMGNDYTYAGGIAVDSEDKIIALTVDDDYEQFFLLTKFNADGTVVWQKTYQDGYQYGTYASLEVDSQNDIVLVGTRVDPEQGNQTGLFALKVDGFDGSIDWCKTLSAWYNNMGQPCMTIDGSDNIIVAGNTQFFGQDHYIFFAKLSSSGSTIWNQAVVNEEAEWGNYDLRIGSMDSDNDGNLYFVGSYAIPNYVTNLNGDSWDGRAGMILKLNSDGVAQWSRIVGPGDCSDLGAQARYHDGKLYAMFQTEKPYYKNDGYNNDSDGYWTQEIVLACYDAENGKVEWANNFGPDVLWGYANPTSTPDNYQDDEVWQGRFIAVHGDYVAIIGQAGEYSRIDDDETRSYGFVAQLPISGEEMDLAGWSYRKNKQAGQYAKVRSVDWSDLQITNSPDYDVVGSLNYEPADADSQVRIELTASGSNTWDFKPNGDLALPVDGNLELSRSEQGSININGWFNSDNNDDVSNWYTSVTTDPEGNKYFVGAWNVNHNGGNNGSSAMPTVTKFNKEGKLEWKIRLTNNDLWTSDAVNGEATAVAYDPSSGNIVVVAGDSGEGNNQQMLVLDINPANGEVVHQKRFRDSNGQYIVGAAIAINEDGERFITGRVDGDNYVNFSVTATNVLAGHNDTISLPRTFFDGKEAPSNNKPFEWYVSNGGWQQVDYIDRWENISGSVRQGSGAVFDITDNGDGSYSVSAITGLGSHYKPGHKIKVLGTALGGADGTNDAVITITAVNGDFIDTASITGTAAGGSSHTYNGVTGANYNYGQGFTIDVQVNSDTGEQYAYVNTGGSNYVYGDVVTFLGTSLGGTDPETTIVLQVQNVGMMSGDVLDFSTSTGGTNPRTTILLKFTGCDFSTGGPWDLQHYTTANSFITKLVSSASTATTATVWTKWIDKTYTDSGVGVDYDSEGNIYWLTDARDREGIDNGSYYQMPLVVKLNAAGEQQWMKTYGYDGNEGYATGLQVDSEDKVVISYNRRHSYSYPSEEPVIKRLLPNGDVLWTKRIYMDGGEGFGSGLALDNDDNIYYTTTRYNTDNNAQWATKLDIQNGTTIWQQEISQGNENFMGANTWWNEYRGPMITSDGTTYSIAAKTYDVDGNEGVAAAVTLPADGSAEDIVVDHFAIDSTNFGYDSNNANDPVDRTHAVATWTGLQEVTNRNSIKAWLDPSPMYNFPVHTKTDAGIKFADGSVQTTSASNLPQVRIQRWGKDYTLKLSDAGKHIYVRDGDTTIHLPPYSRVPFEIGTEITIVHNAWYDNLYIAMDPETEWRGTFLIPRIDSTEGSVPWLLAGVNCYHQGGGMIIKMLKVAEDNSDGSVWIISTEGGNINTWTD